MDRMQKLFIVLFLAAMAVAVGQDRWRDGYVRKIDAGYVYRFRESGNVCYVLTDNLTRSVGISCVKLDKGE